MAEKAGGVDRIHVLWLNGQACTGCSVSFLNATHPSVVDLLTGFIPQASGITLDYHQTIMLPWGEEATKALDDAEKGLLDPFVLVMDGSIPDEAAASKTGGAWCVIGEREGKVVTFNQRLKALSEKAAAVVAAGTCATWGGIPHGKPNPTGAKGLLDYLGESWKSKLGIPIINVPGCPVMGEHLAEALTHAVLTVRGLLPMPVLDSLHRPAFIFALTAHENCPRAGRYANGQISKNFGEINCMGGLGCKGPISHCDVPNRGYIEGVGGCTTVGSVCIGCTMPIFPDAPFSPFLKKAPASFYVDEKLHEAWGSIRMVAGRIKTAIVGRDIEHEQARSDH